MKEIRCPSGAILKVHPAPFAQAKALYQAVLDEAKGIPFGQAVELSALLKDIVCYSFASKRIEICLSECLKRCTYNRGHGDLKITEDVFEAEDAREDYPVVCLEVAAENIRPFAKSLSVVFNRLSAILPADPT